MIDKTVAILAGGKSSRMNYNNKAFLKFREKSFIEHIIKATKNYKEVIIVTNNKQDYEKFGVKLVSDIYIDKGPMAGIHTALINANYNKVLCIACDMPLVKEDVLNYLGNYKDDYEVLLPKFRDRLEPLCGIYSKGLILKIEENLINNKNRLNNLILESDYKFIEKIEGRPFNEGDFANINTPTDFEELKYK